MLYILHLKFVVNSDLIFIDKFFLYFFASFPIVFNIFLVGRMLLKLLELLTGGSVNLCLVTKDSEFYWSFEREVSFSLRLPGSLIDDIAEE